MIDHQKNLPLSGKSYMVTGANGAIGLATSEMLSERGARVLMVCRSEARGRNAQDQVEQKTGTKPDLFLADLAQPDEIRRLVGEVQQTHPRLDGLINIAGTTFKKHQLTRDGLEFTFALNHLGYFVLSLELLALIKKSAPSRIVNLTSAFYKRGVIDFDNLQGEREYVYFRAYANSKLANILFTYELARRLSGSGVTVNCLNPGPIRTITTSATRGEKLLIALFGWLFLKKPEVAGRLVVYLATSPDVEGETGQYMDKDYRFKPTTKLSNDRELAKTLWAVSERLAGYQN